MDGKMKAALFRRGGVFEIAEVPVPVPGPGEALVRVSYCGICGSDLHLVDQGLLPAGAVIGHELTGKVAAVGDGVQGWREGEEVAVMPLAPCGTCEFCQDGRTQHCQNGLAASYGLGLNPGGFAQYMRVKPAMLYRIPAGLDLMTAALTEPWAVARHGIAMLDTRALTLNHHPAIQRAAGALTRGPLPTRALTQNPHPAPPRAAGAPTRGPLFTRGPVLILGAGPIGILSVYALREREIDGIFVSEPDPSRAGRAKRTGARVIDPAKEKPLDVLAKEAGGPPPVVLDCAGTQMSMQEAINIARPAGLVLMLGINMAKTSILPIICFGKELTIKFSFGYTAAEFNDSLLSLAAKSLDPSVLISAVMPLAELNQAFQALHQPGQAKVLIDCG